MSASGFMPHCNCLGPKLYLQNNGAKRKPTPFEHALNSLSTHFATILAHSVLRMPQPATPLFLNNSTVCRDSTNQLQNATLPTFVLL